MGRECPGGSSEVFYRGVYWQIRKRMGIRFTKKLTNGAIVSVFPNSAYSSIFYSKWTERKDMLFIRNHAELANTFVDVGANVGIFSACLFDKFKKFICFEPSITSFRALEETFDINTNINCGLYNIGLSDNSGTMSFIDDGYLSTTSRFQENAEEIDGSLQINIAIMDKLISKDEGPLIIKIDVEGFEEKVFYGAENILNRKQAKLIMFERLGRTNLNNIKQYLVDKDYALFYIEEDGSITKKDNRLTQPLVNLFAVPSEEFNGLHGG